jgi:hypothetical protein
MREYQVNQKNVTISKPQVIKVAKLKLFKSYLQNPQLKICHMTLCNADSQIQISIKTIFNTRVIP